MRSYPALRVSPESHHDKPAASFNPASDPANAPADASNTP
jgi:hypothetical protein